MATCSVAGCERQALKRTLCQTHYMQWKRHGIHEAPLTKPHRRPIGHQHLRADGYVLVKTGPARTDYQLEHRLVMERAIGRPLRTDEHVHHLNGDRADNRLDNLQLMSNEDHQRLHDHLGVNHAPTLITVTCERCGAAFQRKPSRAVTARFCGNECRLAALHERPRTT